MEAAKTIYWPAVNNIGPGALNSVGSQIKELGYKKALLVTDDMLIKAGIARQVADALDEAGIAYSIYSDIQPNPTMKNIHDGLDVYKAENCDFIISIGGGSPQDAGKAIGILATN